MKKILTKSEKNKKYYEEHKEIIKNNAKINKEKINEYKKRYKEKQKLNKPKKDKIIKERKKVDKNARQEYYRNNKEKIISKAKIYYKKRRLIDPLFRLKTNIINSLNTQLRKGNYTKKSRTHKILGCSYEQFKIHIESKWKSWMTWDNYGKYNGKLNYGWDIDHIIPTSSAKTEENLYNLNHYTNLQPLCSYINRVIKKDN